MSHSYAIGNLVLPLLWQGTRVALPQSFSPGQFAREVADSGATVFPGVPFMFERIKALEPIDRLPASLRLLITAGARIDAGTVSWFRRHLDRKVHSFYGSSETGGIAYDDLACGARCSGLPRAPTRSEPPGGPRRLSR
ncbi:MAG TPA: AMP-binding protein [Caldimonas sp.]